MWVPGAIAGVRSPLLLEVAAGLPPNRFRDRRYFGSAAPSSFDERFRFESPLVTVLLSYAEQQQHTILLFPFPWKKGTNRIERERERERERLSCRLREGGKRAGQRKELLPPRSITSAASPPCHHASQSNPFPLLPPSQRRGAEEGPKSRLVAAVPGASSRVAVLGDPRTESCCRRSFSQLRCCPLKTTPLRVRTQARERRSRRREPHPVPGRRRAKQGSGRRCCRGAARPPSHSRAQREGDARRETFFRRCRAVSADSVVAVAAAWVPVVQAAIDGARIAVSHGRCTSGRRKTPLPSPAPLPECGRRCYLRWLPGCRRTGSEIAAILVQLLLLRSVSVFDLKAL
nr:uncharacterized protein LOC112778698 [Arachis hypogaea]